MMIEYILISYFFMLIWLILDGGLVDFRLKLGLKVWIISPLTLPYFIIITFINW